MRAESRSVIVEDSVTGDNLKVNSDGAIYNSDIVSKWLEEGKVYVASDNASFGGTTFEDKILFRNPASSGKTVIILGFRVHLDLAATTNQLNQINVRFHKNPTVSANGTGVGEFNLNNGAADAAVALVTTEPTVSPRGDKLGEGIAINQSYTSVFPYLMVEDSSLLIRVKMNDAANSIIYTVGWAEI